MRPNPSWEHVYAIAFEEFGVDVDVDELHAALRRAYHHGGWGLDGGFEPTEETSFRAHHRRSTRRRSPSLASSRCRTPSSPPQRALHGDQPLAHLSRCVSDAGGPPGAGLVVGAVSNWVWTPARAAARARPRQHFDFIAASSRIGFEKPHPRIFQWALDQAGVPRRERDPRGRPRRRRCRGRAGRRDPAAS